MVIILVISCFSGKKKESANAAKMNKVKTPRKNFKRNFTIILLFITFFGFLRFFEIQNHAIDAVS